jgi:hypothetical protein
MDVGTVNIYACREATIDSDIDKKIELYGIMKPVIIAYDNVSKSIRDGAK